MSNKNELEELNAILKDVDELKQRAINLKAKLEKSEELKAWKPENHEEYWFVTSDGIAIRTCWDDFGGDKSNYNLGNCFPTEERAEQVAEKFRTLLKLERYHDMFCPDFAPDWDDAYQEKYYVYYDTYKKQWGWGSLLGYNRSEATYFDSTETAQKVCDLLNQEESE